MKSVFKSNLSWLKVLLYCFAILLAFAMEENKTETKKFTVKQLQNDFIGLWKNPQKYVEFQLNAERTSQPDAGGLYELRPYYQKINALGEKTNYAIQYCGFENKWQLVEANQIGLFPSLDNELSTIATLLEGDQFSKPTKADIKAYTTYEHMKSAVKTVGENNQELKIKIIEMEKEITLLQTENEKFKALAKQKVNSIREKNTQLSEELIKSIEQNEKCKSDALEQKKLSKMKNEEHKKTFEEMELLKTKLKEKEVQINNKNISINALEKQIGGLSFDLNWAREFQQKVKSMEKDAERHKTEMKKQTADLKNYENSFNRMEVVLNIKNEELQDLKKMNNDKQATIQNVQKHLMIKDTLINAMKTKLKSREQKNWETTQINKLPEERSLIFIKTMEEKTKLMEQISDNLELRGKEKVEKKGGFNMQMPIENRNTTIEDWDKITQLPREEINTLQNKLNVTKKKDNGSIQSNPMIPEEVYEDFENFIQLNIEKIDLQNELNVFENEPHHEMHLETKINTLRNKLKSFGGITLAIAENKDEPIEGRSSKIPNIIQSAQEVIECLKIKKNDKDLTDLEEIMNHFFQNTQINTQQGLFLKKANDEID